MIQLAALSFLRPFLKPLLIILFCIITLCITYYEGYTQGVKQSVKDKQIAELQIKIGERDNKISILETQLSEKEKELLIESNNVKVVTEYKTKQVIVEREKPVYEKRIEQVFINQPVNYVNPDLVRLHDEVICNNQTNTSESKCGIIGTTEEPVTVEDFTKRVIENYQIAIDNQNKLEALQQQIKQNNDLTEGNK